MSYLHKTTISDFDEAYKYGNTISPDELEQFDKIVEELKKEPENNSQIIQRLTEIREQL